MKDRGELSGRDLEIGRQQRSHLGVAILLDDKHLVMGSDELGDFGRERKRADAQRVDTHAVARQ